MSSGTEGSFKLLKFIIGSITLLLLALITVALVLSTHDDLLETDDEYFISTYYTNIGLLEKGAPVRYRGVKIGRVTSVTLQKDMRIRVVCEVVTANKIPLDSKLAVAATTVSGDTYLNLIPGSKRNSIPNASIPENAPILRGLNFIDISSLGSIFADMKDITSNFINSATRLFGKNSYTIKNYKEIMANIPGIAQGFSELSSQKDILAGHVTNLKTGLNNIRDTAERFIHKITTSYPTRKIHSQFQSISKNIQDISQTLQGTSNKTDIASIQANLTNINNWVDSLRIADHSILGILLSKDCGGMPQTVKMVGKAVNTVQDFSLFKKLGFYMDGKKTSFKLREENTCGISPGITLYVPVVTILLPTLSA